MKKNASSFLLSLVILFCLLSASALANESLGDGRGAGDGSGAGESDPLALNYSSVTNGETNVETGRSLKFIFNSNVNNITVKQNNAECFVVTDETGAKVPVSVLLFDDQLEREMRRDIHLDIVGGMKPGKTYTVQISQNLKSKNGSLLGQEHRITFTTAGSILPVAPVSLNLDVEDAVGAKTEQPAQTSPNSGDTNANNSTPVTPETATLTNQDAIAVNTDATAVNTDATTNDSGTHQDINPDNKANHNSPDKQTGSIFWLAGAVIAVLAIIAVVLWPNKEKKKQDSRT